MKTAKRTPTTIRRQIREAAGCDWTSCPVEIVEGYVDPHMAGSTYYFTNKSGDIVRYPGAYSAKYGRPIYHASTRRVEVGQTWVEMNCGVSLPIGLYFEV